MRRLHLLLILCLFLPLFAHAAGDASAPAFPLPLEAYHDGAVHGILDKLVHRAKVDPFNVIASGIFLIAIAHTFLASRFMVVAHRYQHLYDETENEALPDIERDRIQFRAQLFHYLGEIEVIFGLWLIPLFATMAIFKSWPTMTHYVSGTSFAEPIFVGVIMAISASRPILNLAESFLSKLATLGGGTPAAWWVVLLTVGPVLGSFITEPAAMTICALLLGRRFFAHHPSEALKYATLGLLFVNISVGGTLTHFAAPPVVMVASKWNWDLQYLFFNFGSKAGLGIIVSTLLYFAFFRKQLTALKPTSEDETKHEPVPAWITLVHLGFIVWTVTVAHYPALVVIGLLFFFAFTQATARHQTAISIRSPLLVGCFLAALVLHGGGQQWWIETVLSALGEWPLMIGATILTAFNDNAAITYLATLVPNFSDGLKYAVVAGAVAGGGLTVIANAPNPAGQSILSRFFPGGVAPGRLLLGALIPTIIMILVLMLLR